MIYLYTENYIPFAAVLYSLLFLFIFLIPLILKENVSKQTSGIIEHITNTIVNGKFNDIF